VATRLALFLRRRPLVLVALAVVAAVVGGHIGLPIHLKHPAGGLWDGPV